MFTLPTSRRGRSWTFIEFNPALGEIDFDRPPSRLCEGTMSGY